MKYLTSIKFNINSLTRLRIYTNNIQTIIFSHSIFNITLTQATADKEFERFNDLLEKKFPLCISCQVKVNSYLGKQEMNFTKEHRKYLLTKNTLNMVGIAS